LERARGDQERQRSGERAGQRTRDEDDDARAIDAAGTAQRAQRREGQQRRGDGELEGVDDQIDSTGEEPRSRAIVGSAVFAI